MKKDGLRISLGLQLAAIFAVLIAIAVGSVGYIILSNERIILKRILVNNGSEIVRSISGNTADALSQTPVDDTALIGAINSALKSESKEWVRYIQITDASDTLVLASNDIANEWGKPYNPPLLIGGDISPYFIKDGEKIFDITEKVQVRQSNGKKDVGNVHLGLSHGVIDKTIREATYWALAIAAAVLALGIIFSLFLSRLVVMPVNMLVKGVGQISAGNYDTEIKMSMHNELDDLTEAFNEMARNLKEKEVIKNAFSKYTSSELLNEVIKEKGEVHLGGEKRMVSILFSDIRDFTSMAESLDAQEVVKLLNEYFAKMSEVIFRHKGMVNKYMGDAMLAIFGAPVPLKDHPKQAVAAAIEMYDELNKLRVKWEKEKRPLVGMKIGVTTGEVVIGNIGSKEHMEYTVIGDSVNVAARLQALNKNYGTQILISENMYEMVKDSFDCRKVEIVQFKGKTALTLVYEVLSQRRVIRTEKPIEPEKGKL